MRALVLGVDNELATKTIQEAIVSLEARAREVRALVYANPSAEIIELRKAVDLRVKEFGYTDSLDFIAESIEKERKLMWVFKQQKRKQPKLVLELIELDMQIDGLIKELSKLTHPSIIHR
jgi:hypothetical protein